MNYLKLFEEYNIDIRETITDICQELLDDTVGIRLVFQDLGGGYECVIIRVDLNLKQYLKISDVKDELLRIKDYLGNRFHTFKCRKNIPNGIYEPLSTFEISNHKLVEIEYFSFAVFYRIDENNEDLI